MLFCCWLVGWCALWLRDSKGKKHQQQRQAAAVSTETDSKNYIQTTIKCRMRLLFYFLIRFSLLWAIRTSIHIFFSLYSAWCPCNILMDVNISRCMYICVSSFVRFVRLSNFFFFLFLNSILTCLLLWSLSENVRHTAEKAPKLFAGVVFGMERKKERK